MLPFCCTLLQLSSSCMPNLEGDVTFCGTHAHTHARTHMCQVQNRTVLNPAWNGWLRRRHVVMIILAWFTPLHRVGSPRISLALPVWSLMASQNANKIIRMAHRDLAQCAANFTVFHNYLRLETHNSGSRWRW